MSSALSVAKPAPATISEASWQEAGWLPCRLAAEITLRGFTLGDLLSLESGSLLTTGVPVDSPASASVNGVLVGQGQLDAAGERLALLLSELL